MAKIIKTQRAKTASVRLRKKSAKKAKAARVVRKLPARPKASKAKASKPWTPAEVRDCFERFRKANPEPRGELEHLNPYTLLVAVVLSAQATDAGVNKATRANCSRSPTRRKRCSSSVRIAARLHQDHRPLSQQGEECHRAVGETDPRVRRRGAAHPRRDRNRCPAPAARPPMSCSTWPMASTRWRSIPTCFAWAIAPGSLRARRRSRSSWALRK